MTESPFPDTVFRRDISIFLRCPPQISISTSISIRRPNRWSTSNVWRKPPGIEAETVSVGTPDLKSSAEYQETAQTLSARLSLIAEKATEEFWSEEKGRFIEGTIDWDATGHLNDDSALSELGNLVESDEIDYGFLAFNLEAVACGMASDEQAKLIMDWCTGRAQVEGGYGYVRCRIGQKHDLLFRMCAAHQYKEQFKPIRIRRLGEQPDRLRQAGAGRRFCYVGNLL